MQVIPSGSLKSFEIYTNELYNHFFISRTKRNDVALTAALNGEPGAKLRESVRGDLLRSTGTFFTGAAISRGLFQGLYQIEGAVDPSCGAGDLLIEVARKLPLKQTFEETIENWSQLLSGCDIHREFVAAAKLRICLVALQRGVPPPKSTLNVSRFLPNIVVEDGLLYEPLQKPRLVVMNPPYTRMIAPDYCSWGAGLVSSAALFVDRWLKVIPEGGRLVAILPDVLRTGSNYRLWRETVLKGRRLERVQILGRFDDFADVDVFRADFVVEDGATRPRDWIWWKSKCRMTIGKQFAIGVGTIVPHRDPKTGTRRAYLNAKAAPAWGTCSRLTAKIRTKRKLFKPPFVVVRRTSSPNDPARAIGTIVLGTRPVAVENHLLVLTPFHRTLRECRKLIAVLKSHKTTKWLNRRIRCRHLTVEAVRDIPWWND
jgi:hypothetical protein